MSNPANGKRLLMPPPKYTVGYTHRPPRVYYPNATFKRDWTGRWCCTFTNHRTQQIQTGKSYSHFKAWAIAVSRSKL